MTVSLHPQQHAAADTTIPVIDLGPYFAGSPGALEAAAAELRDALEKIGFFIIINHGVPQDLIDGTFAEAKRFHDQPLDANIYGRQQGQTRVYASASLTGLHDVLG